LGIPDENVTRLEELRLGDQLSPKEFGERAQAARHTLWLIAMGMTNDRHLAEDLVQEALAIAWKKSKQFEPTTSFSAWTAAIVRNVALNSRRKRAKQTLVNPEQFDSTPSRDVGNDKSPINTAGRILPNQQEFDDRVVAALRDLSSAARSCLLLRTVTGLSYDKISDLLDIAPGTAMSHVYRARKTLRHRLGGGTSRPEGGTA
jgi:RNA polymerase sigma-70 factor (ECF subfamily)